MMPSPGVPPGGAVPPPAASSPPSGDRPPRRRPVSLAVALCWLLLQGSLALPHLLAAVVIGAVVPRLAARLLGPPARLRSARAAARLAGVVLRDIVVANVTVAWIVLNPRSRPQPAWVRVPLALTHPDAVALLATIITTTPGTVSCMIDEARNEILVHALDGRDPAALVAEIRQRYEAPLKEMFG
jgi:multicomponent K+:H+ antiporter subunit E